MDALAAVNYLLNSKMYLNLHHSPFAPKQSSRTLVSTVERSESHGRQRKVRPRKKKQRKKTICVESGI